MPRFSMFTPFGALAYSSQPSRVENIYRATVANLGSSYDTTPGTNVEASVYANAREFARARYVIDRAVNNADPLKATEMLPVLEAEYGLSPSPTDILPDRRRALAARKLLPNGATYANITNSLAALLGSGFLAYRVTRAAEAVNYPGAGGASPGNFARTGTLLKVVRLSSAIAILGSPQTVSYTPFALTSGQVTLTAGDVLVVDPTIPGITESVKVTASTATTITATFTRSHDALTLATTQPYPYWTSSQRHALVVVTPAVAVDGNKRRQIHDLMARVARGVSTWDIVPSVDATHTAPFTVGDPVLGRVGYAGLTSVVFP